MQPTTKEIGDKGESMACSYLQERGYTLLEKNWRYFKFEIDLIMQQGQEIVFIEVKTRYSDAYGEPWEAVKKGKRQRICISADAYLRRKSTELEPRFDIVSIIKMGERVKIQHIENAFRPEA
jgi:putative endonuclease